MPNLKKAVLIGHVGRVGELKTSNSGKEYTRFSLAVSEGKGENKTTTWFECTAFGITAKNFVEWITVGSVVYVEGNLGIRAYKGKDGEPKAEGQVEAREIVYIAIKKNESDKGNDLPF